MNPNSMTAVCEPLTLELREEIERIEGRIQDEFSRRVHNFHMQACDDGLVLEGRTRTYFNKQVVQQAVMVATSLPIRANKIVVG